MTYGFCATTRRGKSVFSLANSMIYVQNLIQFGKSCRKYHSALTALTIFFVVIFLKRQITTFNG